MSKKKRTIMSLIVLLGCVLAVSATLAWFTDSDETKNRIRIGEFGIDVIESSTNPDASVSEDGIKYDDPVVIGQEKSKIVDIKNNISQYWLCNNYTIFLIMMIVISCLD